jgi:hypothetical protein
MVTLRSSHIPAVFLFAAALLIFTGAVGCSQSEPTPVPATPRPQITAELAVEQSKVAMAALDSFNFELTHDSGFTTLSSALQLSRASGIVATDSLDLEAEANIGRAFVRVEAVVIRDRTWMTNPLTGVWSEIAPEDSPFSFLDPVKLVADILGATQNPAYPFDGESTGEITVTGSIPAPTLAALVGTVNPDAVPSVELTLDPANYVLKKIIISGNVQPEDEPNTVRVITLSEFDKPVSIEPPI